ncbi:MAG: glycosyltransferase family 4 protein [Sedimentisphaerales bacterium]
MKHLLDKSQIKICHLTAGHSPFDDRIFHKEAKTLVKAGYNTVVIAQHSKEEVVDGVKIVCLRESKSRFESMTRVVWKLFRSALKEKADIYHFHDPALIPVGIVLKLLGKKVVYDVHEDYSKQILYKEWMGKEYIRRIVAFVTNAIEQTGVFLFNGIAAATPDIAKKFNPTKTILLRNLPVLGLINNVKRLEIQKDKPIVVYAGGLSRIRGIKEVIQAMDFVEDKAKLWLLGKWENEEFKKECESLRGWKYAEFLGLVPLGEVYKYIKAADVGISILYPIKNYITSLPVKVFEYMACSLPIVMSNFLYWQEIFGECALFADPYSPKDIADKILYLLDNPEKAERMGDKGMQLTREEYNWETESKKLVELYEKLLK